MTNPLIMRMKSKATCVVCGSEGVYLYKGLSDRLFGVEGLWSIRQCNQASCSTLWLDPAPIAEDLHLAYQNYYTHGSLKDGRQSLFQKLTQGYRALHYGYQKSSTFFLQRLFGGFLGLFSFFRESMDYPFIYFKGLSKGNLLELGVGSGNTLKLFANWGWNAEGLDFDPQAVSNALSKGLKVKCGDVFSQSYSSDSFDAIFSSHVLEHVSDPKAVLVESLRLLKSGGRFVAVTPNGNSKLHHFFKRNWRELDPPRHLFVFTADSLRSLAKQAGFVDIKIISSNYSAAGVFFVSHNIAKYGKTSMAQTSAFRYVAQFARLLLTITFRFSKLSGEELILIAHK